MKDSVFDCSSKKLQLVRTSDIKGEWLDLLQGAIWSTRIAKITRCVLLDPGLVNSRSSLWMSCFKKNGDLTVLLSFASLQEWFLVAPNDRSRSPWALSSSLLALGWVLANEGMKFWFINGLTGEGFCWYLIFDGMYLHIYIYIWYIHVKNLYTCTKVCFLGGAISSISIQSILRLLV